MGEDKKKYKVLVGKPEGKRPLEDQGVGGNMGSEWNMRRWIEFDWHRNGTGGGLL
jgi:hypothetical protein